jgi:phosphoadenosine phosphosulfate reductase
MGSSTFAGETESGYASASSSTSSLPQITFTKAQLKHINLQLSTLSPLEILRWAKLTLPSLYQTTAFGLSGLVTLDLLSKLQASEPNSAPIDLIFLDTLYHFTETLELVDRIKAKYPNINIHVYKPSGLNDAAEFEAKYGEKLWEKDADLYDWIAKVEPAERAYSDLSVAAVLTGRRRSQGDKRSDLGVIEVDDKGLVKVNPMFNWSFKQVKAYIDENDVPYNSLLDKGYKSVGDWHSTEPVKEGEDERAGRWKGSEKTECGIHNSRSKYALYLMKMQAEEDAKKLLESEKAEITPVGEVAEVAA